MMNADDYVCSLTAAALASEDGREAVELAMLGIGWAAQEELPKRPRTPQATAVRIMRRDGFRLLVLLAARDPALRPAGVRRAVSAPVPVSRQLADGTDAPGDDDGLRGDRPRRFVAARCRVDCRWVEPSSGWEWAWWSELFATVIALVPREDRDPADRVFPDTGQAQLRTAIARACKAAGVPRFSPHDLRHRRISLWHHQGVPWATIGSWVGQRSLSTTADTYTHVLLDGRDLTWDELLPHLPETPGMLTR